MTHLDLRPTLDSDIKFQTIPVILWKGSSSDFLIIYKWIKMTIRGKKLIYSCSLNVLLCYRKSIGMFLLVCSKISFDHRRRIE